jgi:hypothetical protein
MRTFLKFFAFNVVIIAFFLYVESNSIPQLRQDPRKNSCWQRMQQSKIL